MDLYICLDILIAFICGLIFAFLHRFLKNKFARINLYLFAWIFIACYLYEQELYFCFCGYPLGIHHFFPIDSWFPIIYLFAVLLLPAKIISSFFFFIFWLTAIIFARTRQENESLKTLWFNRFFNFTKFYLFTYLITFITMFFGEKLDFYWGHPHLFAIGIIATLLLLIFVKYRSPKYYWALTLVLFFSTFYYSKIIPKMSDRGANIVGTYSAPKIKFQYLPENDKRDYFSRKIESDPKLEYSFHEFADGWNLSQVKLNSSNGYYFYSTTENKEIFEKVHKDLMTYITLIDDSSSTKDLLKYLEDKSKITFLNMWWKLDKRMPNSIFYDIYIFNNSQNGFYKLEIDLNVKEL